MSAQRPDAHRRAVFDQAFLEDLAFWVESDKKTARRLLRLVSETLKTPFSGTGKPEALKHELSGCWSRRVTQEHRLVYQVVEGEVRFLQGRFHYR